MSKNKLSKGQQHRVQANHQRRLSTDRKPVLDDSQLGDAQQGIVISRLGQHADVEAADGVQHRCNIRRTIKLLVTGDRVVWRPGLQAQEGVRVKGIVEAVHERTSVLTRPDLYNSVKPIAANINQIVLLIELILSSINPSIATFYNIRITMADFSYSFVLSIYAHLISALL